MALNPTNLEFSKRVFSDRLTTDAQGLSQPTDTDVGPGDPSEHVDSSVGARLTQVVLAGHSRQEPTPASHRETGDR